MRSASSVHSINTHTCNSALCDLSSIVIRWMRAKWKCIFRIFLYSYKYCISCLTIHDNMNSGSQRTSHQLVKKKICCKREIVCKVSVIPCIASKQGYVFCTFHKKIYSYWVEHSPCYQTIAVNGSTVPADIVALLLIMAMLKYF